MLLLGGLWKEKDGFGDFCLRQNPFLANAGHHASVIKTGKGRGGTLFRHSPPSLHVIQYHSICFETEKHESFTLIGTLILK
jgi:hypothetical protein